MLHCWCFLLVSNLLFLHFKSINLFQSINLYQIVSPLGSVLFNQCPSHPSLPPLLIIIGLITCLGNLVNIVDSFIGWKTILGFNRQNGDWTRIVIVTNIAINTCDTILTIILGFIIGFTSKPSANSVDGSHYCNPVVYKFSYWFVTLIFIYAALIIILLVVSLALVYIKTHFNTNRDSWVESLFVQICYNLFLQFQCLNYWYHSWLKLDLLSAVKYD